MDVQLYVYDLSGGIARQMSRQFLGIHVDAVYHTSLVFGQTEYFYGAGVQTCRPGTTHHGKPMEIVHMGRTELPIDVILEYLESLRGVYTAEAYDLFAHNCNNFTNDFAQFIVGRGIPEHISSLPQTVLETPFGRMLRPQIDSAMRRITQVEPSDQSAIRTRAEATQSQRSEGRSSLSVNGSSVTIHGSKTNPPKFSGEVYNVKTLDRLQQLLNSAKSSSAIIFFTSATCGPCRIVYPTYDQLAAETQGKCHLIKIDISEAREIASKYSIRATPTFITFLKGKQDSTWTGASPPQLQGAVRMLVQSAFPPHPHQLLSLPNFRRQSSKLVLYTKVPPLEKLRTKLGPASTSHGIKEALTFIRHREQNPSTDAPIPNVKELFSALDQNLDALPVDIRFIAFDVFRLLLADPRISGIALTDPSVTSLLVKFFERAASVQGGESYSLRLCALHSACNVFTAHHDLLIDSGVLTLDELMTPWLALLSTAILDKEKPTLRNAAANLAYNLATVQMQIRQKLIESSSEATSTSLAMTTQVELAAALIEALAAEEESADAVKWTAVALSRLVYLCPRSEEGESELLDLCAAMDAGDVVLGKEKLVKKEDKALFHEVGSVLLKRGLKGKDK